MAGIVWPPVIDNSNNDDWDRLAGRVGENGIFNFIISLYLWSESFGTLINKTWLEYVHDVSWVLARLIQIGYVKSKPISKRARPDGGFDGTRVSLSAKKVYLLHLP